MLDLAAAPAAPGGRNRADGPEGRLQAPWAPDRQDDLSRTQLVHLATGHRRCGQAFDFEKRQVGGRVAPDQCGLGALVIGYDLDVVLLFDDVVGRQHEAGVPHDASARRKPSAPRSRKYWSRLPASM